MVGSTSDFSVRAEKPVLEYKDVFRPQKPSNKKIDGGGVMVSTIWSLRYCKGKGGCLGALASTGDFKVFETKHGYSPADGQQKLREQSNYEAVTGTDYSMLTKRIHHIEHAYDDVQKGRSERDRIVAFDFTNLASSKGTPSLIILRGDQTVGIVELDGNPSALGVSSLGDVLISRPYESISKSSELQNDVDFLPATVRRFKPRKDGKIAELLTKIYRGGFSVNTAVEKTTNAPGRRVSSHESHIQLLQAQRSGSKFTTQEALTLSTVTRRRCAEGYLFDCKINVEVVRDNPWLQRLWKWIDSAYPSYSETLLLIIGRGKEHCRRGGHDYRCTRS